MSDKTYMSMAQLLDIIHYGLDEVDLYDTDDLRSYLAECMAAYPHFKSIDKPQKWDCIL